MSTLYDYLNALNDGHPDAPDPSKVAPGNNGAAQNSSSSSSTNEADRQRLADQDIKFFVQHG